jgi:hypothetical protein
MADYGFPGIKEPRMPKTKKPKVKTFKPKMPKFGRKKKPRGIKIPKMPGLVA